ncbi:TPA: TetR/AcrR family transcriptional regulator [Pseudomonas aeruginosa]|uniref:TetR/AcrR family transcriptional regulator n=1 Tax=Pseudomonas aeruginosa TaxID=287 RepID=UPI0029D9AEA2|nr:TetR/AcrR family transcriptional regulator [Pseudomonas aeruginosa]HCF7638610.1 TetR/AcrR family transcriptional regulator [Pseudomonas aeruginosa]HEJ4536193.1 TetR/AcrR family transcriptional regulator [Pseudomonas aeruginosa]
MPDRHAEQPARQPRTKPAEVRLEELMAAAQQLFLDKGVDATTISDIVAAAGVAKGTFYHYFQAKTDILLALRERFTQAFQQRIANAVEACPANDHPGRLRAWTESGLAGYLEGYRLHDVVYSEHHHHQRGNQERDRVLEQLAELLENGAGAGAWPLRNPRLNALLLYSGLHGAADDAIAGGRLDTQPLAGELADAFLRLLGASD